MLLRVHNGFAAEEVFVVIAVAADGVCRPLAAVAHVTVQVTIIFLLFFLRHNLLVGCHPYPVGIYPASVGLRVSLSTNEAELGTNPFTLTHLKLFAARSKLLAVGTIGKAHFGVAD